MTESTNNNSQARDGIKLLLNNKFDEAKELFNSNHEDIQMAAGYCFLTFMNALMTFEENKLEESLQALKDIEKRFSQDFGWLKSMKNKVLGTFNYPDPDLAEKLEKQIILADSHLCMALLTFLQQDLTSYVKGGWVLMKAWKVYQDTYSQVLNLYKKTFGCDSSIPGSQFVPWKVLRSASSLSLPSTSWVKDESLSSSSKSESVGNYPTNVIPHSSSNYGSNEVLIEPQLVARLMSAISFGYGIFQLCISLLPSSFLKLIHFFGFEGGREAGLSALMFSREGKDMRGPLATLTLLWYHTIVRPFFAVDGSNVKAGVEEAEKLINESIDEFGDSGLFLFFKGRVQRLKSNIPGALSAYESAIDKSNQREIQLLCLHEVGWCYLIQLDWGNAYHCFNQLRIRSKWSQSFYTYLNMRALGNMNEAMCFAEEIPNLLNEENGVPQIKTFISRRIKKFQFLESSDQFSTSNNQIVDKFFCKLLILELLYFWNALPSCDTLNLKNVLEDLKNFQNEPMVGLFNLIEGAIHLCSLNYEKAILSFRKCLDKRQGMRTDSKSDLDNNDDHISAFALFELATIFIQNPETLEDGKQFLLQAQNDYKEYDFEYRLTIRINSTLKKLN